MSEIWTVMRLLTWCREYFAGKQIETPRLDAEVLLAHVLGVDRLGLYLRYDQPLQTEELQQIHALVARRAHREPVAHLVGTKEFHGLSFMVDRRVLTPRPDTELLVEIALRELPAEQPLHVCEVGVGSGCVSISLAVARPEWRITATDLSPEALEMARLNVRRHRVEQNIDLRQTDLLAGCDESFAAVLSNPPYLTSNELARVMPEVAQYEPVVALDGGYDGLAIIRRLLAAAVNALQPRGLLALECGAGQARQIVALLNKNGFYDMPTVEKDLADIERVVTARRKE